MRSAFPSLLALLICGCDCSDDPGPPVEECPGGCARGERCVEGTCLPPVPCEILSCRPEQTCDNGFCVVPDPCLDVECPEGQACQPFGCVPADDDRDRDGADAAEDCDDREPRASPGRGEDCDGLDNDCDGVADEDTCDLGEVCCAAAGWGCTDVRSDADNCGRCGNRCEEGHACCAGLCVDPLTDGDHCGGCDRPCAPFGCLEGARCADGFCERAPADCDDRLSCTQDRCDPTTGECEHSPDSTICGAGQECRPELGCVDQPPCQQGSCDDGIDCTEDPCDPVLHRCDHLPRDAVCDDEDVCTLDICLPALGCRHDPVACEDGDSCTIDRCDPEAGCVAERPPEVCFNGLDDDCDGAADCAADDDCDGLRRSVSSGAIDCLCSTRALGPCGPGSACDTCSLRPEGPRVCVKIDGGWQWDAPDDLADFSLCANRCQLLCCGDSPQIFACDGQQYRLILEGDESCEVEESDLCE